VSGFVDHSAANCPDWAALAATRELGLGGDAAEAAWTAALAHLDACGRCRRPALAADPTLLFRAMPRVELAASEVAAMRLAVASMRRAQRVAPKPPRGRLARTAARLSALGRRGRGIAAAALLAAASGGLWLGLQGSDRALDAGAPAGSGEAVAPASAVERAPVPAEPVFMDLARPHAADVYRVGSGGVQVVMVVDETLDV
jgi:hypothetical protein